MSKWYSFHIKNEILFWFFALALLPLMLITTINYFYQKQHYINEATEQVDLALSKSLYNINRELEQVTRELLLLSKTPVTKQALIKYSDAFAKNQQFTLHNEFYEDFFSTVIQQNQFYDLFLINNEGDIVYTVIKEDDIGTNLVYGDYSSSNLAKVYHDSLTLFDVEFSDFAYYPPSLEDAAFAAIPVYGENDVLGVLAVQVDKNRIVSALNLTDGLGQTGHFLAARKDVKSGLISSIELNHNKKGKLFEARGDSPIHQAVQGKKGKGLFTETDGHEIIASWGYIPILRWGIVAKTDLKEVLLPVEKLWFYSVLLLFFVGLGIVIAIFLSIQRIVTPIERLTETAKTLSEGSLDTEIYVNSDNEIGELSRTFNEMAHSLKHSQETIQKYALDLEDQVKERTHELEFAQQKLQSANDEMKEFMAIIDKYLITSTTDKTGKIISVSQAFCDITGYTRSELIGKNHNIIRHPDMPENLYKGLWQTILQGNVWHGEIKNQRKDGSFYWVDSTITPTLDDQGNIKGFTSIRQDITDKKKVEDLSRTDQLTQLNNRHAMELIFNKEAERSSRYRRAFSIIMFDIDLFKSINDNFGHHAGDLVLVQIAKITKQIVRETDSIGRWGGEEFIIICPETSLDNAETLAEKIRFSIENYKFDGLGTRTASFGVAEYFPGESQESLIKRADDALYEAKRSGRNNVVSF